TFLGADRLRFLLVRGEHAAIAQLAVVSDADDVRPQVVELIAGAGGRAAGLHDRRGARLQQRYGDPQPRHPDVRAVLQPIVVRDLAEALEAPLRPPRVLNPEAVAVV